MSRRVFIDTNIVLDLLGERDPFYQSAAQLATLADKGNILLIVSPISFATVNYFLSKFESPKIAKEKLRKLKILCKISLIDEEIIEKGLNSGFKYFEDSLQYFSALASKCEIIITRNGKDFQKSSLPVMTASEFLNSFQSNRQA
ncbi:PIN domain-containing protein [Salegentibacter sp. JZCK2]|uniref:type II toxin-antitoxin system VapC family toxin n=1 Tax=Salegentibacter tibetensis TaxID=2873600 RepID=UPI001CCADEE4|nr:PIN domain-containing protein [Salegentibacter tibetensis]MBZ9731017.1 PIN domain-containing protein [Salegentibacter tibetensis]